MKELKEQEIIVECAALVLGIFRHEAISDDDQVKRLIMVPKIDNG